MTETIKRNCAMLIHGFLENTKRLRQPDRDAVKRVAIARITSSMRRVIAGGPARIPTECPHCGQLKPSVRAAKYCACRKTKRKTTTRETL